MSVFQITNSSNRTYHPNSMSISPLINSLESEMARSTNRARAKQTNRERVILVGVTTGYMEEAEHRWLELEELCFQRTLSCSTRSFNGDLR
jgi:hypothetical protein